MIAPTHAAFGVLWAAAAQAGYSNAVAAAIGAFLPDIDHPRSAIGRVFFFISQPLNLMFGHRGVIHSFLLWLVPLVIGILTGQELVQWVALGAISHCLIDCYSASGVRAFAPITDRSVVIFKKDWRIKTGSVQDFFLCVVCVAVIFATDYAYAIGGPRKLINLLAKSHKITVQEFFRAGNIVCHAKGSWRWRDGRTEDVEWLVVGAEGEALIYWNGERLIKPKHGDFLRSTLSQSQQEWPLVQVAGNVRVQQDSFFLAGQKWYFAQAGQLAFGTIKATNQEYPEMEIATTHASGLDSWLTGGSQGVTQ